MKRFVVIGLISLLSGSALADEVSPEEMTSRQCPSYHNDLIRMTSMAKEMDGGIFIADKVDQRIEQCKQMNVLLKQFDNMIDNLKQCRKNGAVGILSVVLALSQTDTQMRELLHQGCE